MSLLPTETNAPQSIREQQGLCVACVQLLHALDEKGRAIMSFGLG